MNPPIYILDFQDSFTYQIYSELKKYQPSQKIEVIELNKCRDFLRENKRGKYILGPGPGKPDDYSFLFEDLIQLLSNKNNYFLGICLGHQILWQLAGLKLIPCHKPSHGEAHRYKLSDKLQKRLSLGSNISVQRYNSLAIHFEQGYETRWPLEDYHVEDKELIIGINTNMITYQFHPESVGSEYNEQFFSKFMDSTCHSF